MAGPYIATTSPSVVSPGSMLSTNRERSAEVQTGEFSAVNQAAGRDTENSRKPKAALQARRERRIGIEKPWLTPFHDSCAERSNVEPSPIRQSVEFLL